MHRLATIHNVVSTVG